MSRHETPGDIIASLTAKHSHDGYTSYPELCRAYEFTIHMLSAELDIYRGTMLTPQPGCVFFDTTFGEAPVKIEIALQQDEDDDPPSVVGMLVNGRMVRITGEDLVSLEVQERWLEEYREATDDEYAERNLTERRMAEAARRARVAA